jgi:probable rRNA maturation factor
MNDKNLNLINKTVEDAWPVPASFFEDLLIFDPDLLECSIVLLERAEMKRFNRDYRDKDRVTDVLSFPNGEGNGGDILLCPKEVYAYAYRKKIPYLIRFLHLVVHSMIHLKGYDHDVEENATSMFAQEQILWQWIKVKLKLSWTLEKNYTYTYDYSR